MTGGFGDKRGPKSSDDYQRDWNVFQFTIVGLIVVGVLVYVIWPARSDDVLASYIRLRDAITVYDVGSTILDEDVPRWNAIIQAQRALGKKLNDIR